MRFEYFDDTEAVLRQVLGNMIEFEDQIAQASRTDDVGQVAVHSVTPGLSGAAVFLIRRIGVRGGGFTPWVVKASDDPKLIIEERENNLNFIQGKLASAPKLIRTGSSKLLLFEFAGALADYNPQTLRSGYALSNADALATLMRHIVTSLKAINRLSEDTASCVNRMPLAPTLEKQFQNWPSRLPSDVVLRLRGSWRKTLGGKNQFPRVRSTGHGDLNSGNVLFEPGTGSVPVFIDFASMRRSKDNKDYEEGYHLPFWDYAKLERDIQTRLFLKEAVDAKLSPPCVVDAIRAMHGVAVPTAQAPCEPVAKLRKTTFALREAMQKEYAPAEFVAYRVVLAYAMLTVLFREQPDAEIQDLQFLVAAESSIALLRDPLSPLPIAEKPSAIAIASDELTADGRDGSTVLDVPARMVSPAASAEQTWAGRLARSFKRANVLTALFTAVLFVALFMYRFRSPKPEIELPPREIMVEAELAQRFDMGVNSSLGLTNWVVRESGHIRMSYPGSQSWGVVFVTVGEPGPPPHKSQDFSAYTALSVEMKGREGGEHLEVGIKGSSQPDDGSETKLPVRVTSEWKTYRFALKEFRGADLTKLYVVVEFLFSGSQPETVYLRNVRYLADLAQANSAKPAEITESRSPQTPPADPSAGTIVAPRVSTPKPKTASLAEPPWEDVVSRVRKEYFNIKDLKKHGAFQCTTAPDKTIQIWNWQWEPYTAASSGVTCRQDVEMTQQGGNEVLKALQVAVLYGRSNGRWEFLKVADRPIRTGPLK